MGVYQYKDGKLNSIAGAENAAQVYYDNTGTSLSATNAQDAITELNANLTPSRYYETDTAAEADISNIPDGAIVYTNDGDDVLNARQIRFDDGTQAGSNVETQINNINNDLNKKWTLLWTNQNPTSSFNEQTVVLDLSGYDEIYVHSRYDTTRNVSCDCFCLNKIGFGSAIPASIGANRYRQFDIVSNGIHFYHGYSGDSVADNEGIPLMIYAK